MTLAESRAHFTLWCMVAAPLIAGNDVRSMTPQVRDILTNKAVIAIDQDKLGHQGFRYRVDKDKEIWVKELADKQWAVCLLNTGDKPAQLSVTTQELSFLTGSYYETTNVWTGEADGKQTGAHSALVDSHDVALFLLKPAS
jgi:alpha-galactosidase